MVKKHIHFWCKYYGKELMRYEDCIGCTQPHQVFPKHISCHNIAWKYKRDINTILPKDPSKYPIEDFNHKTVLFYRGGGGLGDLLMITVAVKAFKRKYPSSTVVFQAAPQYIPILENNPYIDGIITLMTDIRTEYRMDFSNPCPAASYEAKQGRNIDKHRIDLFCEYLRLKPRDKKPVFVLTEEEINDAKEFLRAKGFLYKKRIGIALRSAEIWRNWPYEYNIELVELLLKYGFGPIVFDLERRIHRDGVLNVCGRPIRLVASILKFCDLLISADGGLAHLAGALGVPILGLFGPTDPLLRIATYKNARWIVKHEVCPHGYDNSFCWYYPMCKPIDEIPDCLEAIKPKEVFSEIRAWSRS